VNTTGCERVRIALMAALDGEGASQSAPEREHLSTCASCRRWLADLQAMAGQLEGLSYESARGDLWTAVEGRIRQSERPTLARRLWAIGAMVVVWRALQLFVDLPVPMLHPLVPLAAIAAALWLIAGDPLAIETSAPELEKGGV
jgi:predicted anti-sigma-YlaC factor YlaD